MRVTDEACCLQRSENEPDVGQEAIEIQRQVVENNRDDLVVILAGCADRMGRFFESDPAFRSRSARLPVLPEVDDQETLKIAELTLDEQTHLRTGAAGSALRAHDAPNRVEPHFDEARSMRDASGWPWLWSGNRLLEAESGLPDAQARRMINTAKNRARRGFNEGLDTHRGEDS